MAVPMEIICTGDLHELIRPCVDCGQWTGCYCDYCLGADRIPDQPWNPMQPTPLCTVCDEARGRCHYCYGRQWCRPEAWGVDQCGDNRPDAFKD